jgi:serine/threonine protein phosphatase PrpC
MDVAIRGDRASCLSLQLSAHSWLFAVARGFGNVDGAATAQAALGRIRQECERRMRSEPFRRAMERPETAVTTLLGVLSKVNGQLFVRGAAADDYVVAGSSFTAALIVRGEAYVLHAGGTAAYLARRGEVRTVTSDDSLHEDGCQGVLSRALGIASTLDVSVTRVPFSAGDVMILITHRVRGEVDRRALVAHVETAGNSEHLLVIRFDDGDSAFEELAGIRRAHSRQSLLPRWHRYALAGGWLAFALLLTTAWAH